MPDYSVLIVEDDPIIVRVLFSMLDYDNFHILTPIDSGEQVIEQVTLEKPDLVLMDIDLPGPLSGIDTASILFNIFNIPVIFVTGHDEKEVFDKAIVSMPFGFLIKPVEPILLISSIKVSLNMCDRMRQTTEGKAAGLSESIIKKLTGAFENYFLIDNKNRILLANQGAEEFFNSNSSDLLFKDLIVLLNEIDVSGKCISDAFIGNKKTNISIKIKKNNKDQEGTIIIEKITNLFGDYSGSFVSLIFP